MVQNKLSSVVLTADQTHMFLVLQQKSAEKRTQSEVRRQTVPCKRTSDHKVTCAEYNPCSGNN